MNAVITGFLCLWFYIIIYHEKSQGGDAASYTSGFPSRLVYSVYFLDPRRSHRRLIPEMNFVCNGDITGYKVAVRDQNGDQDPIIQIWRKNASQSGSYYKTSRDIAIDGALCVDGLTRLTEVSSDHGVFHCNLNQSTRVSIQAGDILGLELPERDHDDIRLAFAGVTGSGPTNYVFDTSESQLSYYIAFWSQVFRELPQITLEIGSESNCIRGFPDVPVSEVGSRTTTTNMITLLIPEMNFTCTASVVGLIVSGTDLNKDPHSQIQIWRKSSSQSSGSYYQVESVSIHDDTCVAMQEVASDTYWCILRDNFRVSVYPGDILGLELPATNDDEIFFINQGPTNYIFRHSNQLDSNANLSLNGSSETTQQLPQIIFDLTSVHCLSGFPEAITTQLEQVDRTQVITRLFPELKFGCFGTIVRFTAAVWDTLGSRGPKIQIWREDKIQPGLYHKICSNVQIQRSNPPCIRRTFDDSTEIFQCTLREDMRISVQPGDFLGLEIPSWANDDLVIYFKAGGPTNLVFQGQLGSTVDQFTKSHTITNHEPQITFLVVLDEVADSCADSITVPSTTAATVTTQAIPDEPITTHCNCASGTSLATATATQCHSTETKTLTATTQDSRVAVPFSVSSGVTSVVVGGIVGGIIAILLLVAIVLLTMMLIQLRKRKQYTINSDSDTTERQLHNPIYDGAVYNGAEEDVEISCKDDTSINYDHINRSVKKKTVSPRTDNVMYEALELDQQHYEMTGPTLVTNAESYIYWEPANTVNDLHKQLSSNKCRELLQQQVEITKALGSGQFGVVSMGVWQSPMGAMEVAVKQLQPGVTEAEKIRFLQEAAINGQFRHPNVVQLMGVVTTGEPAMIVLELLSNGDLRNFLIKHQTSQKHESGGVDKHLLLRFCQHIASGMSYLASKAFVHRDLAARNILVSKDNICKISDFGMSRDLLDEDYYISRGGMVPVKWTAPEAIHYKKYSTASDVWSFGCVMYEIWSLGHKPFESYNNAEVIKMIDKGYCLPPPPGLTKELYKIMIQCWQPERSLRPTFPQLVELLSRADFELFLWEEEDLRGSSDPRVREIGAPLEIATGLYPDLQKTYLGKK